MALYRSILAVVAAIAIAAPVFADDTTATTTTDENGGTQSTLQTSSTDGATTTETTTETASITKINLNTATAKDLMKVKGLNASKARAIVAYRKKHGSFKSTDDLNNVKGFKKLNTDTLKSITEQLTIE